MAQVRRFLGAVGILVAVGSGTWGFLTNRTDPDESRWALSLAAVGLGLWIQSLAIGDHRNLRLFSGAVGLLLLMILGPIALLAFVTDPGAALPLLPWIGVGFVLWSAAVARSASLSFRIAAEWMIVFLAVALGIGVVMGLLLIVTLAVFGSASADPGPRLGRAFGVALSVVAAAWATRHVRWAATLRALGRAVLARATAEDMRLLAGGPRAFLRPERASGSTPADEPG